MADTKKNESDGFEKNFTTLEKLAEELQDNQISVDELVPRVQSALAAFKICRGILKETESKLTEITAEFSSLNEESEKS